MKYLHLSLGESLYDLWSSEDELPGEISYVHTFLRPIALEGELESEPGIRYSVSSTLKKSRYKVFDPVWLKLSCWV